MEELQAPVTSTENDKPETGEEAQELMTPSAESKEEARLRAEETGSISSVGELSDALAHSLSFNASASFPNSPSQSSNLSRVLGGGDGKSPTPSENALATGLGCEMCANYELRLQQLQESERSVKQQLAALQPMSDRYRNELSAERLYRTELEVKMSTLSQNAMERIGFLNDRLIDIQKRASKETEEAVQERLSELEARFQSSTLEREQWELELGRLRQAYDKLLGRQRDQAATLQAAEIELPSDRDGLQLLALQLREELIETRAAKEQLEDQLSGEILALKEQLSLEAEERTETETGLAAEVNKLRTALGVHKSAIDAFEAGEKKSEETSRQLKEFQMMIGDLETKLGSLQTEKGELEFELRESRKKAQQLVQELENSEAVQRDFVKLSQSLQVELEKIRQAETEVRWEEAAEVALCGACRTPFTKAKTKINCRHCGKVFCESCLSKEVAAGPSRRAAKVCEVCHTLLNRHTKPYFSEAPPETSS